MATAATAKNQIEGTIREAKGKNEARRVRKSGKIPATVYGAGKPPLSISVDPKEVSAILRSATGHNTIFDLQLDVEQTKAMIVDWQHEPIKGSLLHIDLKRIAMDKLLTVNVPVVLNGVPVGVKVGGGVLEQVLREIELECLPDDIPASIEVDVAPLELYQVLRVKELPHGGKLHFLRDPEQLVAHVVSIKEEVEATPAEGAEGAAAPAEPEVIKKGKQEEEGAAEGEKTEKKK